MIGTHKKGIHDMNHHEIRIARISAGLQQSDVAKRIGVRPAQLSQFERHGVPLPAKALSKLNKIIRQQERAQG